MYSGSICQSRPLKIDLVRSQWFDLLNAYNRRNVLEYRSIIKIEGDEEHIPPSLQFPKPVLYYEPIYTLPILPTFGIEISF
jgi:hypothetical protein